MRKLFALVLVSSCFAVSASPQRVATIQQIDFENFDYAWSEPEPPENPNEPWQWLTSPPDQHFQAVGAVHHFYVDDPDPQVRERPPLVSVDSVTYGDLDGDGVEEAIVALNYSEGGTMNWDYLYVYKLERGRPRILARMETGSRGYGGLVRAFVRNELLTVDFADPEKRMGDCCSEGYIRVRYRWQDGVFVEEGERERGKIYMSSGPPRPRFRGAFDRSMQHLVSLL